MHKSGLHYFAPMDEDFTFDNTVSNNKEGFTVRQIKGVESTRDLYIILIYPSEKEYNRVTRSNQIKNCSVIVQDVRVDQKVWREYIAVLRGNTT